MSSGRPRHRGGRQGNSRHGDGGERRPPEPKPEPAADDTPVTAMFRGFASQLDSKHDLYERLVKKSRDVTIESKRIIFMLHRVTSEEQDRQVLEEAAGRFRQLEGGTLRQIAEELAGHDPYLYLRAISPGLQEYIEALSFYHYLLNDRVISCAEVQQRLTYPGGSAEPASGAEPSTTAGEPPPPAETGPGEGEVGDPLRLPLPYHEYVLGLADLTGELMRRCISSVSSGQLEECWRLCALLRTIHEGFVNIGNTGPREITRKLATLRQSLTKVENACYQLKVRGEEIPRHMLADVFSAADDYGAHDDYAAD
ncbi:translin-associated protein X-like [Amphibalanus amphitrite]|uniref:translin-associated protein X-like n=1 Tax=Amphibalanus amphitrite TaxID=1232801 RepID=UPI001C915764|nr:translin-associated protein X-like [Amphibalanus amphitrite]XP_043194858.1 translin-associated protein X-like [Amphibalanus amphitrite]